MNDPRAAAESRPTRADVDHGAMAQLVAHLLCKQGVRGSSPLGSTYLPLSEASYPGPLLASPTKYSNEYSNDGQRVYAMAAPTPLAAVLAPFSVSGTEVDRWTATL